MKENKQVSFNVKIDEDTLIEFKQVVKKNGGKIGFETTVDLREYIDKSTKENDFVFIEKNGDVLFDFQSDSWTQKAETLYNYLERDGLDRFLINDITKDLSTFKDFINSDKCSIGTLLYSQSLVTVNSFNESEPNFYKLEVVLTILHNIFRKGE